MKLYRDLSKEEEQSFRLWARKNYKRYEVILGVWHWVVQDECVKMNKEEEDDEEWEYIS